MEDEEVVQTGEVSEETTSGEAEEKAEPQPLTKEVVEQLIAEATQKAIEAGKEVGRREMQSRKDPEVARAQQGQRLAEETLARFEMGVREIDPEATEVAKLKAEKSAFQKQQAMEEQRQKEALFLQSFNESLIGHLQSLGIDPNDKRVDWGQGATDLLACRKRFDASVSNILKENVRIGEDKLKQELKDELAKTRKELGLDSVDTSVSGGAGKRTFTRDQIANRAFWEANKEDILKAQAEDRIID